MIQKKILINSYKNYPYMEYCTHQPKNLNKYVHQFFLYTNFLFKKKSFYRKMEKKKKGVFFLNSEHNLVPLWSNSYCITFFQKLSKKGKNGFFEKYIIDCFFSGIKKWLLIHNRTLRYVLKTKDASSKYWSLFLKNFRERKKNLIRFQTNKLNTQSLFSKNKKDLFILDKCDIKDSLKFQVRLKPVPKLLYKTFLFLNLVKFFQKFSKDSYTSYKNKVLKDSLNDFFFKKKLKIKERYLSIMTTSKLYTKIYNPNQEIFFFLKKKKYWLKLLFVSKKSKTQTISPFNYIFWKTKFKLNLSHKKTIQKRIITTQVMSLSIKKQIVWKRQQFSVWWYVEKYYNDLDLRWIFQEEILHFSNFFFGIKEEVEKSNIKKRLSKHEKEKELNKKRKKHLNGYLLGFPHIRLLKNISILQKMFFSQKGVSFSLKRKEFNSHITNQFCRLIAFKKNIFSENIVSLNKDVSRKKKIKKRLTFSRVKKTV